MQNNENELNISDKDVHIIAEKPKLVEDAQLNFDADLAEDNFMKHDQLLHEDSFQGDDYLSQPAIEPDLEKHPEVEFDNDVKMDYEMDEPESEGMPQFDEPRFGLEPMPMESNGFNEPASFLNNDFIEHSCDYFAD